MFRHELPCHSVNVPAFTAPTLAEVRPQLRSSPSIIIAHFNAEDAGFILVQVAVV